MFNTFLLLVPHPREAIKRISEEPSWGATLLFAGATALSVVVYLRILSHVAPMFRSELTADPWLLVAVAVPYWYLLFVVGITLLHGVSSLLGGDGTLLVTATILAYVLAMDAVIGISMSGVLLVLLRGKAVPQVLMVPANIWQLALIVMGVSGAYRLGTARSVLVTFVAGVGLILFILALFSGLHSLLHV